MDSLGMFMKMNVDSILQIAKIYQPATGASVLELHKLSVQQQHGTLDCGLFAIAFAVEVCLGNNVEVVSFKQKKMRSHLIDCLNKGIMSPFPKKHPNKESLPHPTSMVCAIKVYCYCKMPEQYDVKMISCDSCNHWFHYSCVNLQLNQSPRYWECPSCLQ